MDTINTINLKLHIRSMRDREQRFEETARKYAAMSSTLKSEIKALESEFKLELNALKSEK